MSLVDVLFIGGGPAGLSAALTPVRQHHTVVVFDINDSRALPSAKLYGISGAEGKSPMELINHLRGELTAYDDYTAVNIEVTHVKKVDSGFKATDKNEKAYHGKKLILASGAYTKDPSNRHCGVLAMDWIAMPQFTYHMSHLGYQLASGNEDLEETLKATVKEKPWNTENRKIIAIQRAPERPEDNAVEVLFEDGTSKREAFIGHAPITLLRGPWAQQLGIEVTQSGGEYVTNGPFQETSVKGVYAVGDTMTPFKAWSNAVFSGAQAAAGIAVAL
ncbi:hypothetical protein B0I35DRAFT_497827 [Stachybotrys elegans]|uniref:FAD/NAD(P)-binding domain-containing protein n=1 Tax=Stachybotrys elegans TaxID=80388 RepID=A0A8K0WIX8_9HYPO|nr:hypothetical protein B0I35DRAFT_497827 [Stachybotrys elegans]